MSLIKCPECGHSVSEFAPACPNCGCPIDVVEEIENEKYEASQPDPSGKTVVKNKGGGRGSRKVVKKKGNGGVMALIIILIIVVLAIAGGLVYYLFVYNKPADENIQETQPTTTVQETTQAPTQQTTTAPPAETTDGNDVPGGADA